MNVQTLVGLVVLALRVRILVPPALSTRAVAENTVLSRNGVQPLARRVNELPLRSRSPADRLLLPKGLAESQLLRVKILANDLLAEALVLLTRSFEGEPASRLRCRLSGVLLLEVQVIEVPPVAPIEEIGVSRVEKVNLAVSWAEFSGMRHVDTERPRANGKNRSAVGLTAHAVRPLATRVVADAGRVPHVRCECLVGNGVKGHEPGLVAVVGVCGQCHHSC